MKFFLRNALALAALAIATQAIAQVTFYEQEGFRGQSFTTDRQIGNLGRAGFNDRASSAVVVDSPWEVCEDVRFSGRCVVLRQGQYPSLAAMGLNDRVSSVRSVNGEVRTDEQRSAPASAAAQVTFYESEAFGGRSFSTDRQLGDLGRSGFNDRASSLVVVGNPWEICEDVRFSGRCVVLWPGQYPSLAAMGLNDRVSSVRSVSADARIDDQRYVHDAVAAQVTFYENEGFGGQSFTTDRQLGNLGRAGFNDRASSAVVVGSPWEVCEDVRFSGRCVVLRPGQYPSLAAMGLNDRVSSVRSVSGDTRTGEQRYAPAPIAAPDYSRRDSERLYEVNVTSVRAVVGTPEQRCWVEREQVAQDRGSANIPGAIAGALIGGILGHQIGGGTGKDVATAGGAFAGAAIGANVGRDGSGPQTTTQDVQRCENVPSQTQPRYWDVTYNFRGQEHRVQMTAAPGPTVTVNERGEPRR